MIERAIRLSAVLILIGGCANGDRTIMRAELEPTEGFMVRGSLTFQETDTGVRVDGEVSGLDPNAFHGFHIHETGDCSAPDSGTARGHFDPTGAVHGDPREEHHHLGDMPNLEADGGGVAIVHEHVDDVDLSVGGNHSLRGRAVIVHAERDDYVSDPDGDSGDPAACGVIAEEID